MKYAIGLLDIDGGYARAVTGDCLNESTVVAFLGGTLAADVRGGLEAHIVSLMATAAPAPGARC